MNAQHTIRVALPVAAVALLTLASAAGADEFDQRGKHEHGKITVNLVVSGNRLTVELESPAINVVGFERAPNTAAEEKIVADATAWLKSGRYALGVPTAAACKLSSSEVTAPEWTAGDAHDHDHEHDHDHRGEGKHEHADFRARLQYDCANVAALTAVELWLLRRLPGTEAAAVNIVTDATQTSAVATPASLRVALR